MVTGGQNRRLMYSWLKRLNLQQVPFLQNVHGVQEVQWVRAGHSYHLYQENQQHQRGPVNNTKKDFNHTSTPDSLRHSYMELQNKFLEHKILTHSRSSGSSRTSRSLLSKSSL